MPEAEYRELRCCMCPNINDAKTICPGIPNSPHPEDSPCRFTRTYQDNRGWQYFVHSGIGGTTFKTFYLKPGKTGGGHGCRATDWRNSFDEAQADLNRLAKAKGWSEVSIDGHLHKTQA